MNVPVKSLYTFYQLKKDRILFINSKKTVLSSLVAGVFETQNGTILI